MKEAYVSFEIAKLLKEKGFDEPLFEFYSDTGKVLYSRHSEGLKISELDNELGNYYPHITHQMAMAWLREKKYISIVLDDEIPLSYKYIIKKYGIVGTHITTIFSYESLPHVSYKEAVEAALKYCLENLIEKSINYEKEYKLALSRAATVYKDENRHLKATLERIFPELKESDKESNKESEDEEIRKWIIYELEDIITPSENIPQNYVNSVKKAIAWLEKQKPVDTKPVFEIGETITDGTSTFTIVDIKDENYITDDGDKVCFYVAHKYYIPFKKQKSIMWSKDDEINSDRIIDSLQAILFNRNINYTDKCLNELIAWIKSLKKKMDKEESLS